MKQIVQSFRHIGDNCVIFLTMSSPFWGVASMPLLRRRLTRSLFVSALSYTVACSNRITVPPLGPGDVTKLTQPGEAFPQARYRIEPGDALQIRFPLHAEMNQQVVVRPDGKIQVAQVGELTVAARTSQEVERVLA